MGTLTALAFSLITPWLALGNASSMVGMSAATPVFGLALAPPSLTALPQSVAPAAQIEASASVGGSAPEASGPTLSQDQYVTQLKKRAKYAKIHRTLGIATWAATGIATIGGTIQYRNLYGVPFTTKLGDTPCVKGNAWPNQDQCSGTPWFHAITGFAAGGLYFSTLTLAILMPDPDDAAKGDSKFAKTLTMHKTLRWVHLAGMLIQMGLGIAIANPGISGLDRANDYDTLKLLSGVHLVSGYVTLGALSYAGTIML